MIHIKEEENDVNCKKDIEMLDGFYFDMKSHNVINSERFTYIVL